jgi:hypothetical protein
MDFVIAKLAVGANLMMHDSEGQCLHMDFYHRRNLVAERLQMDMTIGSVVFVGELPVCKSFVEGREVHSKLVSHDGGNSLARKVGMKFVIVMLTIATNLMMHEFVGQCSKKDLIHIENRSILLESNNSARMSASVGQLGKIVMESDQ